MEKPEISIVIPLYCEENQIKKTIEIISEHVETIPKTFEFVLVDDGSTDRTWNVLKELHENKPNIHAIQLSRNFGKEAALCTGLDFARGKAVIVIDGDLQHPPEMITRMISIWENGEADVVDMVKNKRSNELFLYRSCANLFNQIITTLSGFDLVNASDFKLLDRKVVEAWKTMGERRRFYRGMVAWIGFKHTRIPFDVVERQSGESSWTIQQWIRLALTGIVFSSSIPLHLVTVFGFIFFIFAVGLGIYTIFYWLNGHAVSGFTTVVILQLIIGCLTMIGLGIIGEYIATIYHETKMRPNYIVSDRLDTLKHNALSSSKTNPYN